MQVVPTLVHIKLPEIRRRVHDARGLALLPDTVREAVHLVLLVERGHHAGGQHVVQELEEALEGDVGVREEEDDLLRAEELVEGLQIFPKLRLSVAPHELDGEDIISRTVSS